MIISHTSEFFWKAKYNPFSLATSSSHWAYGSQACCLCCYAFVWASSGSQISPRAAVLFVMCLTMAPSPRQLALCFILWILKHTFCCSAHRLTHGTLFLFWPATAIIVPCISPLGKAKHPLHVLCTTLWLFPMSLDTWWCNNTPGIWHMRLRNILLRKAKCKPQSSP